MNGEPELRSGKMPFGVWMRDHPIYVTFMLIAATVGMFGVLITAIAFFAPSDVQEHIKSKVAHLFGSSASASLQTNNTPVTETAAIEESSPSLATNLAPASVSDPVFNPSNPAIVTNYLFTLENSLDHPISYHVIIMGEESPAYTIYPNQPPDRIPARTSQIDVVFDPSLAWPAADQDIVIDGFPITGHDPTEDDWTNAFLYSFEVKPNGQIDLFPCSCNDRYTTANAQ